ncbi:MAG: hypothetical protein ACK4FV_03545 [Candidatus Nitrosocaldus sp.]
MQITKMTIALELFFKEAILADTDAFTKAMMSNGFTLMSAEQGIVARGNFTARPSRFTRMKGKGMNIAAIAIKEEQVKNYISHINLIRMVMRDEMGKSIDDELEACSLLTNAWVTGNMKASRVVSSIIAKDIMMIKEFNGFIAHRNPFGKIELVSIPRQDSRGGGEDEWIKMELDYTEDDEYILSLHNYTNSLAVVLEYLTKLSSYITSYIKAVEEMVALESESKSKSKSK